MTVSPLTSQQHGAETGVLYTLLPPCPDSAWHTVGVLNEGVSGCS